MVIFLTLSSSKLIVILLTFGKSKLNLLFIFTKFGQVTVILLGLGKTLGCEKQCKPSLFEKKFKNHAQNVAQINDSISGNQEPGPPVNKLASKVQSLMSFFNTFFQFVRQSKICMIRMKTKDLHNWGNIF